MSCSVDTAWQKRGFDSLTCNFIFSVSIKLSYGSSFIPFNILFYGIFSFKIVDRYIKNITNTVVARINKQMI